MMACRAGNEDVSGGGYAISGCALRVSCAGFEFRDGHCGRGGVVYAILGFGLCFAGVGCRVLGCAF